MKKLFVFLFASVFTLGIATAQTAAADTKDKEIKKENVEKRKGERLEKDGKKCEGKCEKKEGAQHMKGKKDAPKHRDHAMKGERKMRPEGERRQKPEGERPSRPERKAVEKATEI